jgi:hypothetical protein
VLATFLAAKFPGNFRANVLSPFFATKNPSFLVKSREFHFQHVGKLISIAICACLRTSAR